MTHKEQASVLQSVIDSSIKDSQSAWIDLLLYDVDPEPTQEYCREKGFQYSFGAWVRWKERQAGKGNAE